MADPVQIESGAQRLSDLPRTLRTASVVGPQVVVTLELSDKSCLALARIIEDGLRPDRVSIHYRDAPLPGFAVAILTFSLGLTMIGVAGDAALGLIDLARLVLP